MKDLFAIELDNATTVFQLLFAFTREDSNGEVAQQDISTVGFKRAIFEVLKGAKISGQVEQRLRAIYLQTMQSDDDCTRLAVRVCNDFANRREILVTVLKILLRLSMDEGMFCRRDIERLRDVLKVFNLPVWELGGLDTTERELLTLVQGGSAEEVATAARELLTEHYDNLGCHALQTDAEIRRSFRSLVKQCHPDAHSIQDLSTKEQLEMRTRFERVQNSYEIICKSRKQRP